MADTDTYYSSPLSKDKKRPISEYVVPDSEDEGEQELKHKFESQSHLRKAAPSHREKSEINDVPVLKKKKTSSKPKPKPKPNVTVSSVAPDANPDSTSQHPKKKKKKKKNDDRAGSPSFPDLHPQTPDPTQSKNLDANSELICQSFSERLDELDVKLQWLPREEVAKLMELWKNVKAAEFEFRELESLFNNQVFKAAFNVFNPR
jgi:hypothetical protein